MEIKLWQKKFGADQVYTIITPNVQASNDNKDLLPIIVFDRPFSNRPTPVSETPEVFLLSRDTSNSAGVSDIKISHKILRVTHNSFPEELQDLVQEPQVVAIPIEMIDSIISIGYITHTFASFDSIDQVKKFSKLTNAYYRAEGRQITETSSLAILAEIESFGRVQDLIRMAIVLCCGSILAIILGTVAWLEFNQELYLTALFQSFGVPAPLLLFHIITENAVLIAVGIISSLLTWKPLYIQLTKSVDYLSELKVKQVEIEQTDMNVIFYFAVVSLLLATVPIAYGLRKPPGLILQ